MVRPSCVFTAFGFCLLVGCQFQAPVVPPTAQLYTSIDAPLDVEFDRSALGSKSGESSSVSVLSLFAFGDASARQAAVNGGISTIHAADYRYTSVLGGLIFSNYTTVVHGD